MQTIDLCLPSVGSLRNEAAARWQNGQFIQQAASLPPREYVGIPWQPYEEFMLAQIVRGVVNEMGLLNVQFPAQCTEDNSLHVHPYSDRRSLFFPRNHYCQRSGPAFIN